MMEFPISGVETYWWLPMVVAFVISSITSTAGISGAFVLMPFQISVLRFTAPGVTPTNLLFNIIAIPSGIYRFWKEKRMVWPLVWIIAIGTIPGLVIGVFIRVRYLPDPEVFKLFVGLVLLYIAIRLLINTRPRPLHANDANHMSGSPPRIRQSPAFEVISKSFNLRKITYSFEDIEYQVSTPALFTVSALLGAIGGIYGIGGGAILAPILVTVFKLPVQTISGAALCGTFINSTLGILFYILLGSSFSASGETIQPDWMLGLMFGIGGAVGIYVGARMQKYIPTAGIKIILAVIMIFVAGKYIVEFF
jgi:uncharacterized membrane protein YfcA